MNFQTRNVEDVKDGEILKSGQSIRVRFSMMDSVADPAALAALYSIRDSKPQVMHRPGQIAMADTDRVLRFAARETRIAKMNDAWRNPSPMADKKIAQQTDNKPDPTAARAARIARMSDAWKGDQR